MDVNFKTNKEAPANRKSISLNRDDLSEGDLTFLFNICPSKRLQNGQLIALSSDANDFIFLIVKGSAFLSFRTEESSARIEFKEGSILHVSPLLGDRAASYELTADRDLTLLEITNDKSAYFPDKIKQIINNKIELSLSLIKSKLLYQNNILSKTVKAFSQYLSDIDLKFKNATASGIIQDLIKNIPKLPTFAFDLVSKLHDRSADTKDIVNTIQSDPSLASMVLKTINSSYYGFAEKITDVYRAVLLLGFNNIYQLVLSQGLASVMPKEPESLEIQKHSTLVSVISQEIAAMSGKVNPPSIATTALLHDIGRIVTLLLKLKYKNIAPLFDLLDSDQIGASLLRTWGLPESIYAVIEDQGKAVFIPPGGLKPEHRFDIAALYVGHTCHEIIILKKKPVGAFFSDCLVLLGFKPKSAADFAAQDILPSLMKNLRRFPEHVRNSFLGKVAQ